jgi:hypothetical protein
MKRLTNLAANLRSLFGLLRIITIAAGFFAFWYMVFDFTILPRFEVGVGAAMTMGEVVLRADPAAVELSVPGTKPGTMELGPVRATLRAKPSQNAAVRAALLQTAVPSLLVTIVTAYLLFTALRQLCGNWEAGDMFNAENLGLVRRIGLTLVVSSLVNAVLAVWASVVVGAFLHDHVTIGGGLKLLHVSGQTPFQPSAGIVSIPGGLITGSLVLMLTAAFRQGLKLKAENDLTV